ncbi:hypothetical protein ACFE04_026757 [Oxalis oulophora]
MASKASIEKSWQAEQSQEPSKAWPVSATVHFSTSSGIGLVSLSSAMPPLTSSFISGLALPLIVSSLPSVSMFVSSLVSPPIVSSSVSVVASSLVVLIPHRL